MKQIKDPGWGMSPKQIDDFYLRWREMMKAVVSHGGILSANSAHSGFFADLIDRLKEDVFWTTQVFDTSQAGMIFRSSVPYDDLWIWTARHRLETPTQFFGRIGFGRMSFKAPTREGVRPWESAVPDEDARSMTPDTTKDTPT
jgi:hypothetical protein